MRFVEGGIGSDGYGGVHIFVVEKLVHKVIDVMPVC